MFQNILALNPKIHQNANLVPSASTKKNKQHWKRNQEKGCNVSHNNMVYQCKLTFNCIPTVLMDDVNVVQMYMYCKPTSFQE